MPYTPNGIPYSNDTDSKAAAEKLDRARQAAITLSALIDAGPSGLTTEQIEHKTGQRHQTASARVLELREAGLIVATGERRRTTSGRTAAVYRVTTVAEREAMRGPQSTQEQA